ncbi:hypothetical protein ACI3KS_11165 [Microbacterium sp. ZW T5_45]|uniref:hypothetical protein n=1 Tax=Microbacterium sp. ZW T5_45 TaxID=3378080 RepID=UPI003854FB4E
MGVFQQRPEDEEKQWAGLPSEPRDVDAVDRLDEAPSVDPLVIGLGADGGVTSVSLPLSAMAASAHAVEEEAADPAADGDGD